MLQSTHPEQIFVTNLEKFVIKADKFIKTYYSGISNENHVMEVLQEMKNMILDMEIEKLEFDCQYQFEIKELMTDYFDSSWY